MKTTIEEHPASAYARDERVNRLTSRPRVDKLRANLNLDAIGVFIVSKRKNGDLILLDGAHRDTALIEEEMGDLPVKSLVFHDLTHAEEAKLFLTFNDRLSVDRLQRFRIEVAAEDPEAIELDKIIRAFGFVPSTKTENSLTCISALQAVYRGGSMGGREKHKRTTEDTLMIIRDAWGNKESATKETVKGIGGLLLMFGDEVDQQHLVEALMKVPTGATAVRTRAHYHTREGGKDARLSAMLAVNEIYSKGLPKAQQLKV